MTLRPLLLLLLLLGAACTQSSPAPRPSILLITLDTCRADHLSCYGNSLPTTPNLDQLARDGRRYAHAFSAAPSTAPSHASILTGKYPTRHTVGLANNEYTLAPSTTTLAELLQSAGYRTGAIVSNPVLRATVGFDQGFATYDDHLEGVEPTRRLPERYADRAVDLALDWLEDEVAQPWFLWLHLQDPHGPYLPPADWSCDLPPDPSADSSSLPAGADHTGHEAIPRYQYVSDQNTISDYQHRYACEISYLDHHLGRLFDHLSERADHQNTLIIVTADHGEALGEDGYYFAHGHSIAPDQVHVPLLLTGPGVSRGETVAEPVTNVSIFATVLHCANLAPADPPEAPSLFDPPEHQAFFVESPTELGVVTGNLYLRRELDPSRRNLELTSTEHWHTIDPSGPHAPAQVGNRLVAEQMLDEHRLQSLASREELEEKRHPVVLTPEELETLRALGYIE